MSSEPPRSASSRRLLLGLSGLGLAAVVGACIVAVIALGGFLYLLRQPKAPEPTVAYLHDSSQDMGVPAEGCEGQSRLEAL